MTITANTKVGEVVRQNFKTAPLFQSNNIDYCCGGNKSISEACHEVGIESGQFIEQLEKIMAFVDPDTEYFNNLPLDELCDFIVKRHHSYVKNNIPFLIQSLEKIGKVHGDHHPELFEMKDLFNESASALTMHMQKEENMLFPYIKKMVTAKQNGVLPGRPVFGSVANPVSMMIREHEVEGNRFDEIAKISNNYIIPDNACTTYKATLRQLKDFEADLHRHIHLENNILFPGAIELEMELS
jgi:regulator of cell morphogenesis and NO signaling